MNISKASKHIANLPSQMGIRIYIWLSAFQSIDPKSKTTFETLCSPLFQGWDI